MENPPSFDLNLAIRDWRESVERMPGVNPQDMHELEAHLRDSVATLQGRNLSLEESFIVAVHRIGPAADLATEFRKVNGRAVWLERAMWMLAGVQLFVVVRGLARVTSEIALLMGGKLSMSPTALVLLASIIYALSFAGVTLFAWRLMKRPPLKVRQILARLLGYPSLTAATIVVASVLLTAIGSAPMLFMVRWQGMAVIQDTMSAFRWSAIVSGVVPLVFVAVSFALLARRNLRLTPSRVVG